MLVVQLAGSWEHLLVDVSVDLSAAWRAARLVESLADVMVAVMADCWVVLLADCWDLLLAASSGATLAVASAHLKAPLMEQQWVGERADLKADLRVELLAEALVGLMDGALAVPLAVETAAGLVDHWDDCSAEQSAYWKVVNSVD